MFVHNYEFDLHGNHTVYTTEPMILAWTSSAQNNAKQLAIFRTFTSLSRDKIEFDWILWINCVISKTVTSQ